MNFLVKAWIVVFYGAVESTCDGFMMMLFPDAGITTGGVLTLEVEDIYYVADSDVAVDNLKAWKVSNHLKIEANTGHK